MTATPSDLAAGIAPGSLEYGNRAPLEAGLSAGGTGAPQGPNPAAGGPPLPTDSTQDPMAALLNGSLKPGGNNDPITAGMSVGAGDGPLGQSGANNPTKTKLQLVAQTAESPMVRAAARNELRRMVQEPL